MSLLSSDVYTVCAADGDLVALVGDRIYSTRQPKRTLPNVVFTGPVAWSDMIYRDNDGAPGRSVVTVQFDCYGSTANEAEEVADAIVALWSGYQSNSPDIGRAHISNYINDGYGPSLESFRVIVDVDIDIAV